MAASGTPQSYLYSQRPANNTRDRSMEQQYTNSGNPYGYIPQQPYSPPDSMGRYVPPQTNSGSPWPAQSFTQGPSNYYLPTANGTGMNPQNQYTPQYSNAGFQVPPWQSMNPQPGGMMANSGQQMNYYPQFNANQQQQLQSQAALNQNALSSVNALKFNSPYNPQTPNGQPMNVSQMAAQAGQGNPNLNPAPQPQQGFGGMDPRQMAAAMAAQGHGNFSPVFQNGSGNRFVDQFAGRRPPQYMPQYANGGGMGQRFGHRLPVQPNSQPQYFPQVYTS